MEIRSELEIELSGKFKHDLEIMLKMIDPEIEDFLLMEYTIEEDPLTEDIYREYLVLDIDGDEITLERIINDKGGKERLWFHDAPLNLRWENFVKTKVKELIQYKLKELYDYEEDY